MGKCLVPCTIDIMASLRCPDCHKLFPAPSSDQPTTDHRWCFVRLYQANKLKTTAEYYALATKHYEEMPARKVVRKVIKVKAADASMNIHDLWASRANAIAAGKKK